MTKIATLTEQCASAHYHGKISSPDSAIILDIFGGTLQNLLVVQLHNLVA
jgi:hypothetical protein